MKTTMQRLYQNITKPLIIKLLFPSLLLFSFTPDKGTGGQKLPVVRKGINIDAPFQRVSINGDISMILTNEPAGTLQLEGNQKDLDRIKYAVKNNELVIDAHRKNRVDTITIYLSAATLKSMLVTGDVSISSADTIKTDDLQIWLNGNINVKVKTTGKITIDAYDGYDLFWKSPLRHNRNFVFSPTSNKNTPL